MPEDRKGALPIKVRTPSPAASRGGARRFVEVLQAEVGDVDITKADVLVSVGRGIEDKENLSIIDELAEAVGGTVSCSRPIVDAKWLEKSRQVGTSGKTVKPKVYMALGIAAHAAGFLRVFPSFPRSILKECARNYRSGLSFMPNGQTCTHIPQTRTPVTFSRR
jgi:hypothetical protein